MPFFQVVPSKSSFNWVEDIQMLGKIIIIREFLPIGEINVLHKRPDFNLP